MPDASDESTQASIQAKLEIPNFLSVASDSQLLTTSPHYFACLPPVGVALPLARSCGPVAHEVHSQREGYAVPPIAREYVID